MNVLRISSFAVAVALSGCSTSPRSAPATPVSVDPEGANEHSGHGNPLVSEADPALASPHGALFTLPEGWTAERHKDHVLIRDPDKQLNLWMVDIEGQADAEAIASAWKIVSPSFSREQDDSSSPPTPDGWDSLTQISYKVSAEEGRTIVGVSRTKDGVSYVLLLDSPVPTLQKRGAQLGQIIESQKPQGLKKESFAGKKAAVIDEAMSTAFAAFIEDTRVKTRVPGAAIAVIQGGKVIFEQGFGVRRKGGAKAVTPDTAFMIGSTTKSLTSLMMAVSVERKLFKWATPMQEVLPSFTLGDKEVAKKVEMQHSVCACTGLPRQDMEFIFEFAGASPAKRLEELATMTPTTGFGETFQYSNALVSAGGFAAGHAHHPKKGLLAAYEAAMRSTVFEPLQMRSTGFNNKAIARGNHAIPHGLTYDSQYQPIPLSYEDAVSSVAPAGGAWSTVRDLSRYVQLELAKGRLPSGDALLSESALMERRKPRIKIGERSAYGLALFLSEDGDLAAVGHNGNTLGFTALVNFFPEHDLGIVILANAQAANTFTGMVERKLIELVLGGEKKVDKLLAHFLIRREERLKAEMAKVTRPAAAEWMKPFVGKYKNPELGKLSIRKQRGTFVLDVGEWKSEVVTYSHAGQSTLLLAGAPVAGLQLQPQEDGSLLLDVGQQKYIFKREGK